MHNQPLLPVNFPPLRGAKIAAKLRGMFPAAPRANQDGQRNSPSTRCSSIRCRPPQTRVPSVRSRATDLLPLGQSRERGGVGARHRTAMTRTHTWSGLQRMNKRGRRWNGLRISLIWHRRTLKWRLLFGSNRSGAAKSLWWLGVRIASIAAP